MPGEIGNDRLGLSLLTLRLCPTLRVSLDEPYKFPSD
jgi:hypothetical protein